MNSSPIPFNNNTPRLSVIIPVYNEEEGLNALFDRLYPALDQAASQFMLSYEIIFINDGSKDRSAAILAMQYEKRPDVTRVVLFANNFGQHMAIMAGFEYAHGEYIITLDADLQNPRRWFMAREAFFLNQESWRFSRMVPT